MYGLPEHHVRRPRLVERFAAARIGTVEAGGGYGKTAFAVEAADALGQRLVLAQLEPADGPPAPVLVRVTEALRRAGLTEEGALVAERTADGDAAIAALTSAIAHRKAPVLLAIDDAHRAVDGGAAVIDHIAARWPPPHGLLVLGRRLVAGSVDAPVRLTGDDLALDETEIEALLANGFGVVLSRTLVHMIHEATGGWAAAAVLAGSRLARAADIEAAVVDLARRPALMAHLVEDAIAGLDERARTALSQFAHLPLLGPASAAATGVADLFERTTDAGLPYTPGADGWYTLPAPIAAHLAALALLDPQVACTAAEVYRRRGEPAVALRLLARVGTGAEAAELLAGLSPSELVSVEPAELRSLVETFPEAVVQARPRVLLHVVRAHDDAVDRDRQVAAVGKVLEYAESAGDPALMREAEAELAGFLIEDVAVAEVRAIANRILAEASSEEVFTRSMALHALGRVDAMSSDPADLRCASERLGDALALARQAGRPRWVAKVLTHLAFYVYEAMGRYEDAADCLDEAVRLLPPGSRRRATTLTFRAGVLAKVGRFDEATADLEEAGAIGRATADERVRAYAAWQGAIVFAWQGDAGATVTALREAERHRGDWFEHLTGLEFLADAVECCDLVGETALAAEYLDRVLTRITERDEYNAPYAWLHIAGMHARSGDAAEALTLIDDLEAAGRIAPEDEWRAALFRAHALLRLDRSEAAGWAARAFDAAATLGHPVLPFVRDRAIAERLVALAGGAGSVAAAEAAATELPTLIMALGRFEVSRGGEVVPLPAGKPAQIVKVLAANDGGADRDQLIEAMWPEVDPDVGRSRLRVALSRLRATAGDIVVRDGDRMELASDVTVDADLFETQARRALAAGPQATIGAVGLARAALARYHGPLLPHDPYEGWAVERRERLERLHLDLLDLLAAAAARRGDVDEMIRFLDQAIEAEPYDEDRYFRAAEALHGAGRPAAALRMLDRAAAMLSTLELPPSPGLVELRTAITAAT